MEINQGSGEKFVQSPNEIARMAPDPAEVTDEKDKRVQPADNIAQNVSAQVNQRQDTVELTVPSNQQVIGPPEGGQSAVIEPLEAEGTEQGNQSATIENAAANEETRNELAVSTNAALDARNTQNAEQTLEQPSTSEIIAQNQAEIETEEAETDNPLPQGAVDFLA